MRILIFVKKCQTKNTDSFSRSILAFNHSYFGEALENLSTVTCARYDPMNLISPILSMFVNSILTQSEKTNYILRSWQLWDLQEIPRSQSYFIWGNNSLLERKLATPSCYDVLVFVQVSYKHCRINAWVFVSWEIYPEPHTQHSVLVLKVVLSVCFMIQADRWTFLLLPSMLGSSWYCQEEEKITIEEAICRLYIGNAKSSRFWGQELRTKTLAGQKIELLMMGVGFLFVYLEFSIDQKMGSV